MMGISQSYISRLEKRIVQKLKREIEKNQPFICKTVYFGGGTPSLLSPQQVAEILSWLNIEQGAKTIYQVDDDISQGESSYSDRNQTVTLTDGQRNQYGLVQQVNPPIYLGAVVLCQGAGDPVVKLSVVEAVSKITGLNANQICVLKME